MDETDVKEMFEQLLKDALQETGIELKQSTTEVAQYMAERAAHLANITQEPGFSQALIAERNNVAMIAGLEVADRAESLDQRIIGIIQGALAIAAGALA